MRMWRSSIRGKRQGKVIGANGLRLVPRCSAKIGDKGKTTFEKKGIYFKREFPKKVIKGIAHENICL